MDPLLPGEPNEVGRYRLLGRLGAGGMGQVFLGQSRGGRLVAVKLVHEGLAADPQFRRRLAQEVLAARSVGGFYTAQVVDADVEADRPWLATAYIAGPSLREAVERYGPLPQQAVQVLGAGLVEGLAVIHACRLVHRDLTPGNVILAADGPRIIDFGISQALDATMHTRSVIGTPSFMSPEQVRGEYLGAASDVFSLGSVLAYAGTGRSPFGTGAVATVLYRLLNDEPDLAGLPDSFADILRTCLAKDPADRPPISELLDRLAVEGAATSGWLPEQVTMLIDEHESATKPYSVKPPDFRPEPERQPVKRPPEREAVVFPLDKHALTRGIILRFMIVSIPFGLVAYFFHADGTGFAKIDVSLIFFWFLAGISRMDKAYEVLELDEDKLTVRPKNKQAKDFSIRWDALERVGLVGNEVDTSTTPDSDPKLVVWFRRDEDVPWDWAGKPYIKSFGSGFFIARPARAVGWFGESRRAAEVRDALARFAGEKFVETAPRN
jgi:serine/threonine protein kinase